MSFPQLLPDQPFGDGDQHVGLEMLAGYAAVTAYQRYHAYRQYQIAVGPRATWAGFTQWGATLSALARSQPRKFLIRQRTPQDQINAAWQQHLAQYNF